MTTDIFICTYWKDAGWLEYCLRSVEKFAKGFRQTIVVYPIRDEGTLKPLCDKFPFVLAVPVDEPEGRGHEFQNAVKTSCDTFSDADYFLHIDSDCLFTEEASPPDYMTDGVCDIVYAPYSELLNSHGGSVVPWEKITTRALGVEVSIETMRRFPMMYPRWLYKWTRDRVAEVNHRPFMDYAMLAVPIPPGWRGYSEFNALGCSAFYFHRDKFYFYATRNTLKPAKVTQFWSHSGLTDDERKQLETILK
jgi:hypothetical protein